MGIGIGMRDFNPDAEIALPLFQVPFKKDTNNSLDNNRQKEQVAVCRISNSARFSASEQLLG
ncbi:hypothetical protein [Syntrophaceticus schinkii]|uniref:hypothetical protein n=1 Tax=Syntrophaceticus schinkii TaxID=499207 RepID=UPI0012EC4A68|nr:hypothetical protein [Syntrophaceticus schinkii]